MKLLLLLVFLLSRPSLIARNVVIDSNINDFNLSGTKIYAFSGTQYLGVNGTVESDGYLSLEVPDQEVRFRVDYAGQHYSPSSTSSNVAIDFIRPVTINSNVGSNNLAGKRVYVFQGTSYKSINTTFGNDGIATIYLPNDNYRYRVDYAGQTFTEETSSTNIQLDFLHEVTLDSNDGDFNLTNNRAYVFNGTQYQNLNAKFDAQGLVKFFLPTKEYRYRIDFVGQHFSQTTSSSNVLINHTREVTVNATSDKDLLVNQKVYVFNESGQYQNVWTSFDQNGDAKFRLPDANFKYRVDFRGQWFTPVSNQTTVDASLSTFGFRNVLIDGSANKDELASKKVYVFDASNKYLNVWQILDSNGQASFYLANEDYKYRVDYQGQWFTDLNGSTTVDASLSSFGFRNVVVDFSQDKERLLNARVYAFDENNVYQNVWDSLDENGLAHFYLPTKNYKFRLDYKGQWFTQASNSSLVVSSLDAFGFRDVLIDASTDSTHLISKRVYVFDENEVYQSEWASFDQNGQASFYLPSENYKYRVDFRGQWFTPASNSNVVNVSLASFGFRNVAVNGILNKDLIANHKVYVFSEEDIYENIYETLDSNAQATFYLPNKAFKYRLDFRGQWFTSATNQLLVDISLSTFGFRDVLIDGSADQERLVGKKVYVFDGNNQYINVHKTFDQNGQATFLLANQAYKYRIDFQGQYFTALSDAIVIDASLFSFGFRDVVLSAGVDKDILENKRAYVFDENDQYMGVWTTFDDQGLATFNLADKIYKFRIDYIGQWFTPLSNQTAIDASLVSFGFRDVAINSNIGSNNLAGYRTYVFDENDVYVGLWENFDTQGIASFYLPNKNYKYRIDYAGQTFTQATNQTAVQLAFLREVTLDSNDDDFNLAGYRSYVFDGDTYQNLNATFDSQGFAKYLLPNKAYRYRIDYSGQHFTQTTSDDLVAVSLTREITIDSNIGNYNLAGYKVYVYQGTQYKSLNATFDTSGLAKFQLPLGTYRYRVDYVNQYYTQETDQNYIALTNYREVIVDSNQEDGFNLQNYRTYVFQDSTYKGLNTKFDAQGVAKFLLPNDEFRYRVDYAGQTYTPQTSNTLVTLDFLHDVAINSNVGENNLTGSRAYVFNENNQYQSVNKIFDTSGFAYFKLPNKAYKYRIDYAGQTFTPLTSSEQIQLDFLHTVTLDSNNKGYNLANSRAYVFNGTSYQSINKTFNSSGFAQFFLPQKEYRYRVDYAGQNYTLTTSSNYIHLDNYREVVVDSNTDTENLANTNVLVYKNAQYLSILKKFSIQDGLAKFYLPEDSFRYRVDFDGQQFSQMTSSVYVKFDKDSLDFEYEETQSLPNLSFVTDEMSISETNVTSSIIVQLSEVYDQDVAFTISSTSGGNYSNPITLLQTSASILAGQLQTNISFQSIDNELIDLNRVSNIVVSSAINAIVTNPSEALIHVIDDDQSTASLDINLSISFDSFPQTNNTTIVVIDAQKNLVFQSSVMGSNFSTSFSKTSTSYDLYATSFKNQLLYIETIQQFTDTINTSINFSSLNPAKTLILLSNQGQLKTTSTTTILLDENLQVSHVSFPLSPGIAYFPNASGQFYILLQERVQQLIGTKLFPSIQPYNVDMGETINLALKSGDQPLVGIQVYFYNEATPFFKQALVTNSQGQVDIPAINGEIYTLEIYIDSEPTIKSGLRSGNHIVHNLGDSPQLSKIQIFGMNPISATSATIDIFDEDNIKIDMFPLNGNGLIQNIDLNGTFSFMLNYLGQGIPTSKYVFPVESLQFTIGQTTQVVVQKNNTLNSLVHLYTSTNSTLISTLSFQPNDPKSIILFEEETYEAFVTIHDINTNSGSFVSGENVTFDLRNHTYVQVLLQGETTDLLDSELIVRNIDDNTLNITNISQGGVSLVTEVGNFLFEKYTSPNFLGNPTPLTLLSKPQTLPQSSVVNLNIETISIYVSDENSFPEIKTIYFYNVRYPHIVQSIQSNSNGTAIIPMFEGEQYRIYVARGEENQYSPPLSAGSNYHFDANSDAQVIKFQSSGQNLITSSTKIYIFDNNNKLVRDYQGINDNSESIWSGLNGQFKFFVKYEGKDYLSIPFDMPLQSQTFDLQNPSIFEDITHWNNVNIENYNFASMDTSYSPIVTIEGQISNGDNAILSYQDTVGQINNTSFSITLALIPGEHTYNLSFYKHFEKELLLPVTINYLENECPTNIQFSPSPDLLIEESSFDLSVTWIGYIDGIPQVNFGNLSQNAIDYNEGFARFSFDGILNNNYPVSYQIGHCNFNSYDNKSLNYAVSKIYPTDTRINLNLFDISLLDSAVIDAFDENGLEIQSSLHLQNEKFLFNDLSGPHRIKTYINNKEIISKEYDLPKTIIDLSISQAVNISVTPALSVTPSVNIYIQDEPNFFTSSLLTDNHLDIYVFDNMPYEVNMKYLGFDYQQSIINHVPVHFNLAQESFIQLTRDNIILDGFHDIYFNDPQINLLFNGVTNSEGTVKLETYIGDIFTSINIDGVTLYSDVYTLPNPYVKLNVKNSIITVLKNAGSKADIKVSISPLNWPEHVIELFTNQEGQVSVPTFEGQEYLVSIGSGILTTSKTMVGGNNQSLQNQIDEVSLSFSQKSLTVNESNLVSSFTVELDKIQNEDVTFNLSVIAVNTETPAIALFSNQGRITQGELSTQITFRSLSNTSETSHRIVKVELVNATNATISTSDELEVTIIGDEQNVHQTARLYFDYHGVSHNINDEVCIFIDNGFSCHQIINDNSISLNLPDDNYVLNYKFQNQTIALDNININPMSRDIRVDLPTTKKIQFLYANNGYENKLVNLYSVINNVVQTNTLLQVLTNTSNQAHFVVTSSTAIMVEYEHNGISNNQTLNTTGLIHDVYLNNTTGEDKATVKQELSANFDFGDYVESISNGQTLSSTFFDNSLILYGDLDQFITAGAGSYATGFSHKLSKKDLKIQYYATFTGSAKFRLIYKDLNNLEQNQIQVLYEFVHPILEGDGEFVWDGMLFENGNKMYIKPGIYFMDIVTNDQPSSISIKSETNSRLEAQPLRIFLGY